MNKKIILPKLLNSPDVKTVGKEEHLYTGKRHVLTTQCCHQRRKTVLRTLRLWTRQECLLSLLLPKALEAAESAFK